jgi:hypothetical protein
MHNINNVKIKQTTEGTFKKEDFESPSLKLFQFLVYEEF